jgi:ribosomal protein S8
MKPYYLSDFLVKLKKASLRNIPLIIEFNTQLLEIIQILQKLGYLTYTYNHRTITIHILPSSFQSYLVHSKPSKRIYVPAKQLRFNNLGLGSTILRTHRGFLSFDQAKTLNLGGELLFTIF